MATPDAVLLGHSRAALLVGAGLGGFLDGIVLHQILGWHHMLSDWYPPTTERNLRLNMVGDGLFHLGCLILILVGIGLLNHVPRLSDRILWGGVLAGWGTFNLLEGLIAHHLLGAHHVNPGAHKLVYDLGFLAGSAALSVAGTFLSRSAGRDTGR